MKNILISDFTVSDIPYGGSEWVNQVIIDKFNLGFIHSNQVKEFDKNNFYIISNISLMRPDLIKQIPELNYIIIEHDYKICNSRHPWKYQGSIVPKSERTNYEIYKNAKAVFVQTNDHLRVFKLNDVEANFVNLHSSIWSENDLCLMEDLLNHTKVKNDKYAIYQTDNWIKNTTGAISYCVENNINYDLIPNMNNRIDFLQRLAECHGLVFFPIARETFCRLVVEAKCLNLDVITSRNYGASLEGWFDMSGDELISFLRHQTKYNLDKIKTYLNEEK